ncbi:MAG: hypothetical protein H7288_03510 [Kineosporiaceae bacterium]|nr:hypothetical protein [Aeromicrobium sp.]
MGFKLGARHRHKLKIKVRFVNRRRNFDYLRSLLQALSDGELELMVDSGQITYFKGEIVRKLWVTAGVSATAAVVLAATGSAAATPSERGHSGKHGKNFVAQLLPLNAGEHTVGTTTFTIPRAGGTAAVRVKGDDVTVTIKVRGVTPLTLHPQHIHAGTVCPIASDDKNRDSFVDVIEGLPKYGPILISLDKSLNNFATSLDFPVSDSTGRYQYSAKASKSHLQAELKQALKLGKRHVVIHGINPTDPLPSTVQTLPGLPAWATLPVACGELHRVK